MAISSYVSGTVTVPYMAWTNSDLICEPPIQTHDFSECGIPGGSIFWRSGGFYSPGVCFEGYRAVCTQTSARWPIRHGETAVRCIPTGYDCDYDDPRYATTVRQGIYVSAPAFEIRWRTEDLTSKPLPADAPAPPSPLTERPGIRGPTTLATSTTTAAPADRVSSAAATTTPSSSSYPGDQGEERLDAARSLSTGSVAGIAVGASVGVLGMSMTALFVLLRRRRRQDAEEAARRSEDTMTVSLSGVGAAFEGPPVETGGRRAEPRELAAESSTIREGCLVDEVRGERSGDRRSRPVDAK